MAKEKLILFLLVFFLIAVNYSFLDDKVTGFLTSGNFESVHVDRIIDGDTIESNGTRIRLLGINTPERGEEYYLDAKKFLEELILNETVQIEFGKDRIDRYGRTLAYIFYNGENINQKQIENGFANYYFLGKDKYYSSFKKSWEQCIIGNKNLCEKSNDKCSQCIVLKNLDYKMQEAVFYNQCSFSCNLEKWDIKDEGRKHFAFQNFDAKANDEFIVKVGNETNNGNVLFWNQKEYVWTKTGDTLFLRDSEGKLVLWEDTRER